MSLIDIFTVKDVLALDGEYELDWEKVNGHDLHLIKKLSGVRANELSDAIDAGDWDVHVACALIAMRKAGHAHADDPGAVDALMAAPMRCIQIRPKANGDQPDPPEPQPE
jgi:hypothetical protein